jgi:CheY-like chemotaxis protein
MQTGKRAAELTRQLLAFSRKQVLIPEVIQLNKIVARSSRMLERLLGADIQLQVRLADDLELVKMDPVQIEQVLLNLAVNARDAMPGGGILTMETLNLSLGEEDTARNSEMVPGKYAVLAVRDTGCGMEESIMRQIFEPFFTTKDLGKGTGLGLATVHGIVRQSGGHITVSSEVGKGTVFHIYLPAVNEPLAPPRSAALITELPGGTETILLAEDKDDVRAFIRRTLETFGYKVLEARNGDEAMRVHDDAGANIDLLLTDAVMPRMNGGELARRLSEKHAGLKVLFTSGYSDDPVTARGANAAVPFLQKPFTSKALLAKVREALCDQGVVVSC